MTVKLLISDLLGLNINSNCDTQSLFLNNFVDILDDFDDLWHNDDLLNDLLKDVRNFNDLFGAAEDWHDLLFVSVDNLSFSFDLILNISLLDVFIFLDDLVLVDNDLFNFSSALLDCNNFLFNDCHFNDFLVDDGDFDWPFSD